MILIRSCRILQLPAPYRVSQGPHQAVGRFRSAVHRAYEEEVLWGRPTRASARTLLLEFVAAAHRDRELVPSRAARAVEPPRPHDPTGNLQAVRRQARPGLCPLRCARRPLRGALSASWRLARREGGDRHPSLRCDPERSRACWLHPSGPRGLDRRPLSDGAHRPTVNHVID